MSEHVVSTRDVSSLSPTELNHILLQTEGFRSIKESLAEARRLLNTLRIGQRDRRKQVDLLANICCAQATHNSTVDLHDESSIITKIRQLCVKQVRELDDDYDGSWQTIKLCDDIVKKIHEFPMYWDKDDYKEVKVCCVCMVERRDIIAKPCKHLVFCVDCYEICRNQSRTAATEFRCPICRGTISDHEIVMWRSEAIQIDKDKDRDIIKPPRFIMSGIFKDTTTQFELLRV